MPPHPVGSFYCTTTTQQYKKVNNMFLLPFIILAAGNTYSHRQQMLAERMDAETRHMEYNLHVAEFNAAHPVKYHFVPKAELVGKRSHFQPASGSGEAH
jgi:hypothetical protein